MGELREKERKGMRDGERWREIAFISFMDMAVMYGSQEDARLQKI